MAEETTGAVTIEEKPKEILETFPCPECNKRFPTKQGLKGHIRFSHPFTVGARLQEGVNPKEGERKMATVKEEVMEALKDIEKEKQGDLTVPLSTARQEVEDLKAKVTQLEATLARGFEPPSVAELVEHCQSGTCPGHKAQLDAFLTQIRGDVLSKLTKDEVKPLAEKHGLWPPKNIVIEGKH